MHAQKEIIPSDQARAVIAQADRASEDRALDDAKQSVDLLTFLNVQPGMHVAELGCGTGFVTELLARSVGPSGLVFAQNSPKLLDPKVAGAWTARLAHPAMAKVVRADREFDDPFPVVARDLDLVYLGAEYETLGALKLDREALDHAVHLSLKHGGRFVVLDRVLPDAQPPAEAHREESRNARREIEAVGFSFVSEGRFIRTSTNPYDWDAAPGATSGPRADVFALMFVKP